MGSINEKLTYLNETKQAIKNSLNELGCEITNEDTFREYANKIDELYVDMKKVTDESEFPHLSPTKAGKIELELEGNSYQNTNILTYKCAGTETGDYYFVYSNTNYQFTMPTISANDLLIFNTSTKKLYKGTIQITTTTASTGTLITLSSTPSLDYPQDIHVVTGDNTIKVLGKNLLNATSNWQNAYIDSSGIIHPNVSTNCLFDNYIRVTPNTTYIFSSNKNVRNMAIHEFDDDKTFVKRNGSVNNVSSYLITTTATTKYLKAQFNYDNTTTITQTIINNCALQLEQGSTATTYEPYTETIQLLSLGSIELAKIGTYTDRIFKSSGKWYVYKAVGKFVLNGSETITQNSATFENVIRYTIYKAHNVDVMNITSKGTGFNNQLPILNSYDGDSEHLYIYNNVLYMFYDKTKITGLNALYTFLSNNNLIVYGRFTTPTTTEITDTTLIEQLNNLENLKSYNNQTNISQENEDMPFIINASALLKNE